MILKWWMIYDGEIFEMDAVDGVMMVTFTG
jgi:hypothetical protein